MNNLQEKIYTYFERDPKLRVLFIFDNGFKKDELHNLEWAEGYRYVEFDGCWFTAKYNFDHEWANDKVVFVLQQGSPVEHKHLKESFPLMDILVANTEYHDLDYMAFIHQYNLPENLATFVSKNISLLQTEKFLKLFAVDFQDGTFTEEKANRGFISSFLNSSLILDWNTIFVRLFLLAKDENKLGDFFKRINTCFTAKNELGKKVNDIFGVPLFPYSFDKVVKLVEVMKYNAITQLLSPVEADNYKPLRIKNALALQRMNQILELALTNQKTNATFTEVVEKLGSGIHEEDIIKWYGTDANYFYVPENLCIPIIRMLADEIQQSPEKVARRLEEIILNHSDNGAMKEVISYLTLIANYYQKVQEFGSYTLDTPQEYVNMYKEEYYKLDSLYRQALEMFFEISPLAPIYDTIQKVKIDLDVHYHKVTFRINQQWLKCLNETSGFTQIAQYRQDEFFNKEVKNVQKKQVVIISDALRYEVAQELLMKIAKKKHIATLNVALAMLPTETKYCKPSLIPHNSLKMITISDNEQDMEVDGVVLKDLQKRQKQLEKFKEGAICLNFDEVAKYDTAQNREWFKHPLVYIFHDAIDKVSHDGSAEEVVKACRKAIDDIAKMIPHIHDWGNVTQVIVTSDHGFLFNDIVIAEKDKLPIEEETLERKTRYYVTKSDKPMRNIIKYALPKVSGMGQDLFVAVPDGTNRMMVKGGDYQFAHGGASLQEMLIPILTSSYEEVNQKEPVRVTVLKRNLTMTASRLKFTLVQVDAVSMECKERTVVCGLYYNDELVTKLQKIELNKTDALLDARQFIVDLTLAKNVDSKILQLRIYDENDMMNPLDKLNVINKTSIEMDF